MNQKINQYVEQLHWLTIKNDNAMLAPKCAKIAVKNFLDQKLILNIKLTKKINCINIF